MCVRERGEADVTLESQLSMNPNKGSMAVDCSILATFPKVSQFSKKTKWPEPRYTLPPYNGD